MQALPVLLVVEDEVLMHLALEDELNSAGYDVVFASNGTKAIEELTEGGQRFRAVITDIRLGEGPNGWQVAEEARKLKPDMPIVYMSGDSKPDWGVNGVPASIMIAKPFAMSQLVTAVSQLITEAGTRSS